MRVSNAQNSENHGDMECLARFRPHVVAPLPLKAQHLDRVDDKLSVNWVFIDLLHGLLMQGLDVLERLK